ncbi:MAG: hypothetical protein ACE5MI_00525 [Acidimicrobiia bacterium]
MDSKIGKRRPRVLIPLVVIAAFLLSIGGTAYAKGPESATITGPSIDRPIQLMDRGKPRLLSRLITQTGLWYPTGDLPVPIEGPPGRIGPRHTLTWINSGPPGTSAEQRTMLQFLYLDAEGGPLIHTPAVLEGWGPEKLGWFAAPIGLPDTLAELGVRLPAASPKSTGGLWYLVAALGIGVTLAGSLVVWRLSR